MYSFSFQIESKYYFVFRENLFFYSTFCKSLLLLTIVTGLLIIPVVAVVPNVVVVNRRSGRSAKGAKAKNGRSGLLGFSIFS